MTKYERTKLREALALLDDVLINHDEKVQKASKILFELAFSEELKRIAAVMKQTETLGEYFKCPNKKPLCL